MVVGAIAAEIAGQWIGHVKEVVLTYCAHVCASLLLAITGLVPAPDAQYYDHIAQWRLAYWRGTMALPPTDSSTKDGFPTVLAGLYRLMGIHLIYGALLNAILVTLAMVFIGRSCQRLGMAHLARPVVWLGLLPGFVLWSGLALREAGVWVLCGLILYAGTVFLEGRLLFATALTIVGVLGLATFRGTLMPVIVVGILGGAYLSRRRATPLTTSATVLVIFAAVAYAASSGAINALADPSQIDASRSALSRANSGFDTVHYQSSMDALIRLPQTLPNVLFGPFPSAWSAINVLAPITWAVWLWLLWNAVRGFLSLGALRTRWLFVPPAAALAVVIAITSGNWGTLVRMREQVALFLVPLAAQGFSKARQSSLRKGNRGAPAARRAANETAMGGHSATTADHP